MAAFRDSIVEADLEFIGDIDPRLCKIDDWQLILSIHRIGRFAGLITNDAGILALPRELCVLHQTRLSLVVPDAAGHDPLRAIGLLLTHLPNVVRRLSPERPQIFHLRASTSPARAPWDHLHGIARHQKMNVKDLIKMHEMKQLDGDPFDWG